MLQEKIGFVGKQRGKTNDLITSNNILFNQCLNNKQHCSHVALKKQMLKNVLKKQMFCFLFLPSQFWMASKAVCGLPGPKAFGGGGSALHVKSQGYVWQSYNFDCQN